mmetsp:Transcript_32655/g.28912  ORF Transcript_32655/g.28912 Transcript_32655/m.28912 type:complete len:91 (-) Transcript_32655:652-924(-)
MTILPKFGESPAKRVLESCDFIDEELVSEEKVNVNNVPIFKSRFNFSERKGKINPEDLLLLKAMDKAGTKTLREIGKKPAFSSKTILELK